MSRDYTLKNFPRFNGSVKEYLDEVIPWKIGFEKQAKNRMKLAERELEKLSLDGSEFQVTNYWQTSDYLKGYLCAYKEILE